MDVAAIGFHKIFHDCQAHPGPYLVAAIIPFRAESGFKDVINCSL